MTKFNRDNVLSTLASIVDEYGADHVYERAGAACYYSNEDGTPSCIVGHIIYRLEPDVFQQIHGWEWADGEYPDSCAVFNLGDEGFELDYESEAEAEFLIGALGQGQGAQDSGRAWGEAEDTIRAVMGEGPRHGEA